MAVTLVRKDLGWGINVLWLEFSLATFDEIWFHYVPGIFEGLSFALY